MKGSYLRVIHLETGKHLYGGALQVAYLLKEIKGLSPSLRHTLVVPKGSPLFDIVNGVERVEVAYSGEADPRLFLRLIHILGHYRGRGEKTLLHIHSRRGADLWGPLAATLTRTPFVITRRVDNPEPHAIQWWKYRVARKVVAISSAIEELMLSYGVKRDSLILIPSAVDTETFRPGGDRAWFSAEFDLTPGEKVIGMVAQFIPRKGHRYVLGAIPKILKAHPEARFIFFGIGPLKGEIEARAKTLGVGWACRFPGFRTDMARIMPCLDCLLHPALMEGLGVAVLQAMACKVPVVATSNGGLRDIIFHEESAIVLKNGNDLSKEIENALIRLLEPSSATFIENIKERAYNMVKSRFSCESMATAYRDLYTEIFNTPS